MNTTPMLLDLLIDENQQAIAVNAEYRRVMRDAQVELQPAPIRKAMGRALISLGERVGGMHREAIATIAAEHPAPAVTTPLHRAA
ncbi:MAG: hypothetical protein WBA46_04925 [Thermomicrobiales bacterium]